MKLARSLAVLVILIAAATPLAAARRAFKETAHGSSERGPQRRSDAPRGSCVQCHDGHRSHASTGVGRLSVDGGEETTCESCHALSSPGAGFPGVSVWQSATHASSQRLQSWTDEKGTIPRSRCSVCHDPHGIRDQKGVIPAMLRAREDALCVSCHDGSDGADVRSEQMRPFVHGRDARGDHDPAERDDPTKVSWQGQNRHVSCSDCHNAHRASEPRGLATAPEASPRLAGVSRVQVINGGPGTVPTYRWLAADDPAPLLEYEICFKCHSSWTKLSPRSEDLARVTNPENASFHPIQAAGRNRNVDPAAFVAGIAPDSLVLCTSCHASDDSRVRGPHGSSFEFLLKKRVSAPGERRAPDRTDLCFECHAFEVYADPAASESTQRASRFNGPESRGHVFHVSLQQIACADCHTTHGSARNAALMAGEAIRSYNQSSGGGSCATSCHAPKNYQASYAR